MKTMNAIGVGLFLALTFSCKKDESVSACMQLEGTWQCESWQEEGEELLSTSSLITSADIQFKTLTDNQGDYELNINYLIGGSEFFIGSYTVNSGCDQVTITPKAGLAATYHFTIEGDILVLEGTLTDIETIIRFRKS